MPVSQALFVIAVGLLLLVFFGFWVSFHGDRRRQGKYAPVRVPVSRDSRQNRRLRQIQEQQEETLNIHEFDWLLIAILMVGVFSLIASYIR